MIVNETKKMSLIVVQEISQPQTECRFVDPTAKQRKFFKEMSEPLRNKLTVSFKNKEIHSDVLKESNKKGNKETKQKKSPHYSNASVRCFMLNYVSFVFS